jgi:hypothetical protein
MTSRVLQRMVVVLGLVVLTSAAYPCSWAIGYFHQVTRLRGKVVGVNSGDLRHPFRWMRQHTIRSDAKLTLYEYRWPAKLSDRAVIKVLKTDQHGQFDFGALPTGHYTLVIEDPWGGASWFDVEVAALRTPIEFVTIDISPVHPDCTGGHEFVPTAN